MQQPIEVLIAVLVAVALLLAAAVALYNRPQLLVPPHLRELPGAVDELKRRGSRTRLVATAVATHVRRLLPPFCFERGIAHRWAVLPKERVTAACLHDRHTLLARRGGRFRKSRKRQ